MSNVLNEKMTVRKIYLLPGATFLCWKWVNKSAATTGAAIGSRGLKSFSLGHEVVAHRGRVAFGGVRKLGVLLRMALSPSFNWTRQLAPGPDRLEHRTDLISRTDY